MEATYKETELEMTPKINSTWAIYCPVPEEAKHIEALLARRLPRDVIATLWLDHGIPVVDMRVKRILNPRHYLNLGSTLHVCLETADVYVGTMSPHSVQFLVYRQDLALCPLDKAWFATRSVHLDDLAECWATVLA